MSANLNMPRKAIVLAAGLGVRLRPFTLMSPKALMPLGGQPLIEHTLHQLEAWGVTEIAVNLHWLAPPLSDYLRARRGAARIHLSREPQILGTAGALRPLRDFVGSEPVWIVNADIVWRVAPTPLVRAWQRAGALAALWLVPDRGPRTVETDASGAIATYRSERRGAAGTATFSGLQLVAPRIYDYLPDALECSLIEVYERAAAAGERVLGVTVPGRTRWDDAGTVEAYLRLRRVTRRERKRATAPPSDCSVATVAPQPAARTRQLDEDFRVDRDGHVWFPAQAWPDAALAPVLVEMGWPLESTEVEPLPARGSDRSFLRLRHDGRTAMYVRYGTERDENARYAAHARFLRDAGVPVPRVLAELAEARAIVMEDAGRECVRDLVLRDPACAEHLYLRVIDMVVRLHRSATAMAALRGYQMAAPFGRDLYLWERDLFLNHIVRGRHGIRRMPVGLPQEYAKVAQRLTHTHSVAIVHRDLQSSNLMLRHGRIKMIDFQGMRYGAAAYDLASLLCDPYVRLPAPLRGRLLAAYAARDEVCAAAARDFAWGAVQRMTQALGAYGRLTGLGLKGWEQHIIPAAETLSQMASLCGLPVIAELARATVERERAR
ncbi:MAG: phosphotransferase [Kiritimatiellae bacterium]|nr:phosphotransferase [Kiritimatiellia bacterium]